jgi:tetratricopeptide (TPR) repeat protein
MNRPEAGPGHVKSAGTNREPPLHLRLWILGGVPALCILAVFFLWWSCRQNNRIPFLPAHPGAQWIVYPKPAVGARQPAQPLTAVFQKTFELTQHSSAKTELTICAFEKFGININGRVLPVQDSAGEWKSLKTVNAEPFLQPGTNLLTVSVTNESGPPALWLSIHGGALSLTTDESWQVSLAGSDWQQARPATLAPTERAGTKLYGTDDARGEGGRLAGLLLIVAAGLCSLMFFVEKRFVRTNRVLWLQRYSLPLVLGGVLLLRLLLFLNDAPALPRNTGFDASAHEEYVQFMLEKHALPLPNDGWEMFQPPLYYAGSALLLSFSGLSLASDNATVLLRAMNGLVGLLQCWVAFLCLRELFPGRLRAQCFGLVLVAFLPPTLYLSQYVTNEPLAGLFVTVAIYFCLKAFRPDARSTLLYVGIGAALGAALLTKASALLALPVFLAALALAWWTRKDYGIRKLSTNIALIVLSCVIVCGWHYARIWAHFGKPLVGNWESGWWQDPGFRTGWYYLGFGHSLTSPQFSSLHTFADGFYSTLWSDGLLSGAARLVAGPPWNYDWLHAACLLAIPLSLLTLAGIVLGLIRLARHLSPAWFLVLGLLGIYFLGVLYMSLKVPSYAQVKAFYAFPAFLPLAAVFALGCEHLEQLHHKLRLVCWPLLLVWFAAVYAGFWIRHERPEAHLSKGLWLADSQRDAEAVQELSSALQRGGDTSSRSHGLSALELAEAHSALAATYERQGHVRDAIEEYRAALRACDDYDGTLNNLAWLLATTPEAGLREGPEAVRLAERACRLTHNDTTIYMGTLAAAYAEAGRFDDAVATAQKAVDCARLRNEPQLAERNQQLLELFRARKAYHEPK